MTFDPEQMRLIDRFLANPSKVLDGYQPHWIYAKGYQDHQLPWPIYKEDTGLTRAQLRFRLPDQDFRYPSLSLFVQGRTVCRLDRADEETCKPNSPFAHRVGLPPLVCGTHIHDWTDNRPYIEATRVWDVPVRRPVGEQLTNIDAMFFWFCDHINVRIQPHNRPIVLPDVGLWSRGC